MMLKLLNSRICLELWWGSLAVQSEARVFFVQIWNQTTEGTLLKSS